MQARTLKALSLLLQYPEQELLDHLTDVQAITDAESALSHGCLNALYQHMRQSNMYLLEEHYVALFDRGRGTSLYLFEHVHGESRDRGQAMVDLLTMYRASGFILPTGELPDYLPVFLEYLAQLDVAQAKPLLQEISHLLRTIGENLAKRGSHYYLICSALLELVGEPKITTQFVARDFDSTQEDYDNLDKSWTEAAVTFGGGCSAPDYGNHPGEAVVQFIPHRGGQNVRAAATMGA